MLSEALLIAFCIVLAWVLTVVFSRFAHTAAGNEVCVVVLGDIGRSPRMQYHALSFAREGYNVTIVGYSGSTPHKEIRGNPRIRLKHLTQPPSFLDKVPRIIRYGVKVVWQILSLLIALLFCSKPAYILLQNPPALPSMAVCWLASVVNRSYFIIDWHNYGYTILSLAVGKQSFLVRVARWYESLFGGFSHGNLCVTNAMREDLEDNWGIEAVTMYDRPPKHFKPTDVETRHELFCRLAKEYEVFRPTGGADANANIFTTISANGQIELSPRRPALLISSTSWTPDEDFSILLGALQRYEDFKISTPTNSLPSLICVITGKGPEKEYYTNQLKERSWTHVKVCTPWLEAEDYPKLLGSADLGVCLHKSSSDLDLPMKVVDMFGCGVPVCAVHFECLNELVKHGENGLVFESDAELFEQLKELLCGHPQGCEKLRKFRENLVEFGKTRWHAAWRRKVLPLLRNL